MKINHSFPLSAILFLVIAFSFNGFPQKLKPKQTSKPNSLTAYQLTSLPANHLTGSWKQVDSLANLGLPKSALEIVDQIYAQAKTEKNDPQVIKSIIYRIRLNSDFQENFLATTIASLQKEISASASPSKQVLQSILAEVYWKY